MSISYDLETINRECADCTKCRLHESVNNVVFGEGNPNTDVVLVGEAPGAEEDLCSRPFVGRAGKLLNNILTSCGVSRDEVYITNIIKCKPPDNRMPDRDEIKACFPYLKSQIQAISPHIIVLMGKTASSAMLGRDIPISKERGTWHKIFDKDAIITYHPAALLRDPRRRQSTWEDFQSVFDLKNNLKVATKE